jgi:hypothetical protein
LYILHYAPDNASLIIRLVLEEAGLPYRTALADRAIRAQDSAAYLKINPAGLIPALETPVGPIFETGAILLWLADKHDLGPKPDACSSGDFLKWLFFISNTAHADLRRIFYSGLYTPPGSEDGHYALAAARMKGHFALLDHAATEKPRALCPALNSDAVHRRPDAVGGAVHHQPRHVVRHGRLPNTRRPRRSPRTPPRHPARQRRRGLRCHPTHRPQICHANRGQHLVTGLTAHSPLA